MEKRNNKMNNFSDYDYLSNAASFQDITGLIPMATPNVDAWDCYAEIYPFLPVLAARHNIGDQFEEQLQGISPEKYL